MTEVVKVYFRDRDDAAKQLLNILPIEKMKGETWNIIASSPNGIPIAKELAKVLNAKCDLMLSEKIFAPLNRDCEVAIVTESEEVVIHEELVRSFEIDLDFIFEVAKELRKKIISKKLEVYKNNQQISDFAGQNILLVDEGLNTGLTMMACIKTAINLGAKSVSVAVPIIPNATINDIESIADDLYFVHKVNHFVSIDSYYKNLEEINLENLLKGNVCQ